MRNDRLEATVLAWVFVKHHHQRNLANKIDGKANSHNRGTTLYTQLLALLQHGALTYICMAHIIAMSLA